MNTQDLKGMERIIRLIEIALFIGRNIVRIIAVFVGITIAIAIYNFAIGGIAWGIVGLALGIAGLVFLVQISQTRRRHYHRRITYRETRQKHRQVQAA